MPTTPKVWSYVHCIESGDVPGHAGYEARQECRETQGEHAGREEVQQHDGDAEVIVVDRLTIGIEDRDASDGIDYEL